MTFGSTYYGGASFGGNPVKFALVISGGYVIILQGKKEIDVMQALKTINVQQPVKEVNVQQPVKEVNVQQPVKEVKII